MKKQGLLLGRGYIFGLGAFRRYKEITGHDISHFEEALKPDFLRDEKGELILEDELPVAVRSIDDVEASYRWAVMLKCANDVYCNINEQEQISVDHYTVLLNDADQSESNELVNKYLDSNYLGKPMREYYGIPKPQTDTKKKPSTRAKRTQTPSK